MGMAIDVNKLSNISFLVSKYYLDHNVLGWYLMLLEWATLVWHIIINFISLDWIGMVTK